VAEAVNASTQITGVSAAVEDGDLTFTSTATGSDATVTVEALSGSFDVGEGSASGTDAVVEVNGQELVAENNVVHVRTDTLNADIALAEGFAGSADPVTVSGSAPTYLFASNPTHTISLALPQVNSAQLGGAAGRLSDVGSGGSASLTSGNVFASIEILDAAQAEVLDARARLGAFEHFSIESARSVLSSTIENVSRAFSQIADADVALESAKLVKSLTLVESAASVLQLAGTSRNSGFLMSTL
jgi:flagellin-like hook-associated protein FlgL